MAVSSHLKLGGERRVDNNDLAPMTLPKLRISDYIGPVLLTLILVGIIILLVKVPSEIASISATTTKLQVQMEELKNKSGKIFDAEENGYCSKSDLPLMLSFLENLTNLSKDLKVLRENLTDLSMDLNILRDYFTNVSHIRCNTENVTFTSCVDILRQYPTCSSGYYLLKYNTAYPIRVYCDLTRNCGGTVGGWRRIAYLNIHEPGTQCPGGFTWRGEPLSCVRTTSAGGCTAVTFSTNAIPYTQVCGRVNAIHYNTLDGFETHNYDTRPRNPTIDDNYVDGISLTSNGNDGKRTHIWTFGASSCKLSGKNVPSFVGSHYSFDGGKTGTGPVYQGLLWDEYQCPSTTSGHEPWFNRSLPHNTHNDLELRVCRDQEDSDEDLLLQLVEIYVQ